MINYVALMPHSPLLIFDDKKFKKSRQAFKKITQDLDQLKIQGIVSISSHPRFYRTNFSVYTHPHYTIQFSDFGDLISKTEIQFWWTAYNNLKKQLLKPIEPIDTAKIDYGHGIPLYELFKINQNIQPVLTINDHQKASDLERNELGQSLKKITEIPYALLISQDLAITDQENLTALVDRQNIQIRQSLSENWRSDLSVTTEQNAIHPPCLNGIMQILKGALDETWKYEELAYEKIGQSTLLTGRFMDITL